MQSEEFANTLNFTAFLLSMNAWVYSTGEYSVLSGHIASAVNLGDYFASGNVTEANPYIIETKEQLENLSMLVNIGAKFEGEYIKLGKVA